MSKPATRKSDLADWHAAQYVSSVGLAGEEGGERFKRFTKTFPVKPQSSGAYPITGRQRMVSFLSLKLRYPLGAEGYTCLAMGATSGRESAHYAYAYWRRGHEEEDPEYICVSPTFDSRDGEYRRRFIRYPVFAETYEKLASQLAPLEEAVISMAAEGKLELKTIVYPEDELHTIADRVTELRLMVTAFTASLALDLWQTVQGMLMIHTSEAYTRLIAAIAALRPRLVAVSETFRQGDQLALFERGSAPLITVQCGQKLVPMFNREAMQSSDYNLAAWRELAVTRLVGDLVINYVSPAFAIFNQWTYVEGADAALFENAAMKERYTRGHAVEEATRSLREARRRLAAPEALQNYYTEELSARVYESLEYAQSFLLMSPVAIAHTMEDVGWSLRSVASYVRRAPTQWPAAEEAFADLANTARYLFDVAFGAHCLHTKLGVAHTDLHGNNMTFYMWGLADRQKVNGEVTYEPFYDDPVVAYVAGPRGEADTYVFPAAGASGCLIDYSRCILGPAFRPHLEEGRSPAYATHFYRDQVNRVMRTFHRYAPSIVEKNEAAIKAAVLANFDSVFPVLCAVDFVAIGRSVGAALADAMTAADDKEVRPFQVSRAGIDLAGRLEKEAQELLVTGLHDLAAAAGSRRQMPTPAFPGDRILARVFAEWKFSRWEARRIRDAQLVDAYRWDNPLRYSGSDYAKYPPWARLDEIERHLGEYRLTDLFERGVEPFLEALQPGARVEIIAERLRAEQEKLDGEPVSTASSWLDE
jgi:hypothetical protein